MQENCHVFGCGYNRRGKCIAPAEIPHVAGDTGLTDTAYYKYRNDLFWDKNCASPKDLEAARQAGDKVRNQL